MYTIKLNNAGNQHNSKVKFAFKKAEYTTNIPYSKICLKNYKTKARAHMRVIY